MSQYVVSYNDPLRQTKIRNTLTIYGFCVITDVLDDTQCNKMTMDMANTLSYATQRMNKPFNVTDTSTYGTLSEIQATRGFIFQNFGLGQSQVCWDIRTNNRVISCFNDLYNTPLVDGLPDLLVSMDGFSFSVPPEMNNNKGFYKNSWYHFDQSTMKNNFECVQGWVTGLDVNEGDATLSVMVGSHNFHHLYGQFFGQVKDDWVKVDDLNFFTSKGCYEYRVVCPRGSLVMWDSRTLHYGSPPLQGRKVQNYRAIVYVCYTPRSLATKKELDYKIKYFMERGSHGYKRTMNHWPHRPKVFPELPRSYDGKIPDIAPLPDPVIDPKYRRLIGFN